MKCVLTLKVNWFEYILGNEWKITPAGGATGEAYFAQNEDRKLFLKRNSSPFLAVLSAEGIVPKLVWTKRTENGDVITAQHWLNGRELKPIEMSGDAVAKLLSKIHQSKDLLEMLKRMGKRPLLPESMLKQLEEYFQKWTFQQNDIDMALDFLREELPYIQCEEKVVCHCDINHNNWLLSNEEQLYLIDWDGAMISDPAIDIGMLLYWYIPRSEWESWLSLYGLTYTTYLHRRMRWYVISQTLFSIQWFKDKNNEKEIAYWIKYIKKILEEDKR